MRRRSWVVLITTVLTQRACAQCPAGQVSTLIGGQELVLTNVPALLDGGSFREPCDSLLQGYDGEVDVLCIGGNLIARSHRCRPASCPAGEELLVRFEDANATLAVKSSRALDHGSEEFVPCRKFFADSYEGHIRLACRLGKLTSDSSECRPTFVEQSSVWRIVNADRVATSFRIYELGFYTAANCRSGRLFGQSVASNEDVFSGDLKSNAFDGDVRTAWGSRCPYGCDPSTAWLGVKTLPSARARCVRFLQSSVACCTSKLVRLEVWDGNGWQSMHEWDTELATQQADDPTEGLSLVVPITCDIGKPDGIEGVEHDCDGPPVRGRQSGDICYARCSDGYYGGASPYECLPDGSFAGIPPSCYEIESTTRYALLGVTVFFMWFAAHQYQFWCMYKKVRLRAGLPIPSAMLTRWKEQDAQDVWELILKDAKKKADDHMQDMLGGGDAKPDPNSDKAKAAARKTQSRKSSKGSAGGALDAEADVELAAFEALFGGSAGEKKSKRRQTFVHGLCNICEDPDVCLAYVMCPICRIADTWHTLGKPFWMTYWNAILLYYLCPFCIPCFNYFGRHTIRQAFRIPLEPHRDTFMHCCCACCCSPCASCQEARLVDAPSLYYQCRKKLLLVAPEMPTAHSSKPDQDDMD